MIRKQKSSFYPKEEVESTEDNVEVDSKTFEDKKDSALDYQETKNAATNQIARERINVQIGDISMQSTA